MPPMEPVQGVAKVVVNGTMGGVAVVNIFHWARTDRVALTSSQLAQLATELRAAYVSHFIPGIHPDYVLGDVEAIDLTSELGASAVVSGSTPGSAAGAHLPSSVAVCITWKIARRYRGGHPRTYLPPPGDVAITSSPNRWDADFVTQVSTAASSFRADMLGVATMVGELVTVHRYRTLGDPPVVTTLKPPLVSEITGSSVDPRIDSQRRRLGPDVG